MTDFTVCRPQIQTADWINKNITHIWRQILYCWICLFLFKWSHICEDHAFVGGAVCSAADSCLELLVPTRNNRPRDHGGRCVWPSETLCCGLSTLFSLPNISIIIIIMPHNHCTTVSANWSVLLLAAQAIVRLKSRHSLFPIQLKIKFQVFCRFGVFLLNFRISCFSPKTCPWIAFFLFPNKYFFRTPFYFWAQNNQNNLNTSI